MPLLIPSLVSAALAAQLQMTVQDDTLHVGQAVELQVQLVDGSHRGVPQVDAGRGLQVKFSGQGQSTVIRNFQTTRIVRYSYELVAVEAGEWQIGPVELTVDGDRISAGPIRVTVEDTPKQKDAPAEIEAVLSNTRPYEGEVVVHHLVFRHRDEVHNLRLTPAETPGFIPEPSVDATQTESTVVDNGVRTGVIEMLTPLRAVSAGAHTISPAVISADVPEAADPRTGRRRVDMFGRARTRTQRLATRPVPVTVQPLPRDGRPAGFSGLVGKFSIRARPSARQLALGETLTLEIVVEGLGSLAGFQLPKSSGEDGFRIYDDAPEVRAEVSSAGLRSRAVLRRALVPEREGTLTLDPIELSVFDPSTGAYTTVSTSAIAIKVLAGDAGGKVASFSDADGGTGSEVGALGDDILPAPGAVTVSDHSLAGVLPWVVGAPVVPALGLLGLGFTGLVSRREPDPWAVLRQRLAALPTEPAARLSALESIFRDAAALRLGISGPAVDLAALGPLGDDTLALFKALNAARYGGGGDADLTARVVAFVGAR